MKIGAVSVGQSPRRDLLSDMLPLMPGVDVIETGVFDGLTDEQVTAGFSPGPGDTVLVTRLADGRDVCLAGRSILGRLRRAVGRLEAEGVSAVLVLSTAAFPVFRRKVPVYAAGVLVRSFTVSILNGRTLGLISSDPRQNDSARRLWQNAGAGKVLCASASPYREFDLVVDAAMELCAQGAEILVLDSMGFSSRMKQGLRACLDVPVILPRTVAARVLAELLGEP